MSARAVLHLRLRSPRVAYQAWRAFKLNLYPTPGDTVEQALEELEHDNTADGLLNAIVNELASEAFTFEQCLLDAYGPRWRPTDPRNEICRTAMLYAIAFDPMPHAQIEQQRQARAEDLMRSGIPVCYLKNGDLLIQKLISDGLIDKNDLTC